MLHAISLVVALLCVAATNLFIKAGAKMIEAEQGAGGILSVLTTAKAAVSNPWIIGGMICGIINLVAYTFALRKVPVNLAYPITATVAYVIIVGGAAVWFSERLTAWQIVGIGLILAGVWLMAAGVAKTA